MEEARQAQRRQLQAFPLEAQALPSLLQVLGLEQPTQVLLLSPVLALGATLQPSLQGSILEVLQQLQQLHLHLVQLPSQPTQLLLAQEQGLAYSLTLVEVHPSHNSLALGM